MVDGWSVRWPVGGVDGRSTAGRLVRRGSGWLADEGPGHQRRRHRRSGAGGRWRGAPSKPDHDTFVLAPQPGDERLRRVDGFAGAAPSDRDPSVDDPGVERRACATPRRRHRRRRAILGCLGAVGPPPDLVLSGINLGFNVGRSALHSGTVGAAITAAAWGAKGLAVSTAWTESEMHWDTAASVALDLVRLVHGFRRPEGPECECSQHPPRANSAVCAGRRWRPSARSAATSPASRRPLIGRASGCSPTTSGPTRRRRRKVRTGRWSLRDM